MSRKTNMYRYILWVFFLVVGTSSLCAQTNHNQLIMSGMSIVSSDVKASATWYRRYMRFKMVEYRPDRYAKMTKGGFNLTLIQGKNTIILNQVTFAKGKKYVNGIGKVGFATNQFDSLSLYLERYEEKFTEETHYDQNLGVRTMTVEDPDGNKIQFLDAPDGTNNYVVLPKLFSINSSDYITTLKWYKAKMGFEEIELKDDSNIHFQNYLKRDQLILELIHLPYESLETTEFMPVERDLASIDQLSFKTGLAKKVAHRLDNNGNKIVLKD